MLTKATQGLSKEAHGGNWRPLMVKAVAGGGGRGVRRVTDISTTARPAWPAHAQGLDWFGSDALLIERAPLSPRHVGCKSLLIRRATAFHLERAATARCSSRYKN